MLKMKLSEVFHDYEIWKHGSGKNAFFTVEAWGDEIAFRTIEEARNFIISDLA